MSEGKALLKKMENLLKAFEKAREMTDVVSADAMELGGAWDQEIASDLLELSSKIGEVTDEYRNILEEAIEISSDDEYDDE